MKFNKLIEQYMTEANDNKSVSIETIKEFENEYKEIKSRTDELNIDADTDWDSLSDLEQKTIESSTNINHFIKLLYAIYLKRIDNISDENYSMYTKDYILQGEKINGNTNPKDIFSLFKHWLTPMKNGELKELFKYEYKRLKNLFNDN